MRKITTVFVIDRDIHRATTVVREEWVLQGQGKATVKFDGTSCMIQDGKLYKRFDRKQGKSAPDGWMPCEAEPDAKTGHWPGWLPVDLKAPEDRWHAEAFADGTFEDGTYELVGPKVQGNRYKLSKHELWRHGTVEVIVERTFEGILKWLTEQDHEGLVFHHPDGRMAKIRRKDFGLRW